MDFSMGELVMLCRQVEPHVTTPRGLRLLRALRDFVENAETNAFTLTAGMRVVSSILAEEPVKR